MNDSNTRLDAAANPGRPSDETRGPAVTRGVLIEQGMPPEAAGRHLQRQADIRNTTIGMTSRALLLSL
jgi:hypothetical protein